MDSLNTRRHAADRPAARLAGSLAAGVAAALCCLPGIAHADPTYDTWIQRARAGDHDSALAALRERLASNPGDRRAAWDRIVIAGWAGRSDEVLQAWDAMGQPSDAPAPALAAVARAYRDSARWDDALARYREGRARFPDRADFALGEILVLADSGHAAEAVALGKQQVEARPADADARLALVYAYTRAAQPYDALFEADQAHSLAPQRDDVVREYVRALQRAGLPEPALRLAKERPGLFEAPTLLELQLDAVAEQVRLARMPTRREAERFVIADRALANYDRLLPQLRDMGAGGAPLLRRARIDRLAALHARMRMRELVDSYEALLAEGNEVPAYALANVASAYLYLRQPERAEALYRQVLDAQPAGGDNEERLETQTGLYYAFAEAEAFDPAGDTVRQARDEQRPWLWTRGQPMRQRSDLWLQAEMVAAQARRQADDTVQAQQRLEEMVRKAPGHTGLRAALADVYRARNWPRAAENELKLAEALSPRSLSVEVQQGHAALELQEWRQAQLMRDDTMARFPEDLSAQRLDREWRVHNKSELRIEGYRGLANDSAVVGNGNFGIESILYSPPIAYDWRAFAGVGYATGRFQEGSVDYTWARAGAQWRVRDLTVEGEVSTHFYGQGGKPGARLSAEYDLGDRLQVGSSAAIRSTGTPLRALNQGIYADTVSAYARWRHSERAEWMLTVAPSRFSDGNDRLEAGITGFQRVYTAPHLKGDLLLDVWTSRNNRNDTPYFNPRADLTVLPSLRLTHTLYRHYETAWEQQFLAGAGTYSQRDYGTGAILLLGYGQRFRTSDVFDVGATVTGTSRPYDGRRERELRIVFDLTYRF
ncbi:poly-beta-1,6 N-acetyl-D-glucosamine export porin PgaA [Cupriavidus sp. AU9028]|uniref:poly-beta-1,6 N-acetyl-D-glucosamine export porin PgaA n=1 Tax=Cupriavidus sp. AU9028 TaxID=2871157 RepID=UPI001C94A6B8|nr:poly-beta-1,6 N-acetyl-D-glucosamine export porin PgaA [Cupriavidus sp. AU9028]MBY4895435.1 poly-beta-1,6 N-acetyl-D-glucosamine export porin PgaA [Cupriavidus sp. AU9028]